MIEVMNVLLIGYGVALGLFTAINLGKQSKESKEEAELAEEAEQSLEMMVGKNLDKQKNVIKRIVWLFFFLYFCFSLFSLILLFNYPVGLIVSIILIIAEIIEQILHLYTLNKATEIKQISKFNQIGRLVSYIHLIGVPIIIGLLL